MALDRGPREDFFPKHFHQHKRTPPQRFGHLFGHPLVATFA